MVETTNNVKITREKVPGKQVKQIDLYKHEIQMNKDKEASVFCVHSRQQENTNVSINFEMSERLWECQNCCLLKVWYVPATY